MYTCISSPAWDRGAADCGTARREILEYQEAALDRNQTLFAVERHYVRFAHYPHLASMVADASVGLIWQYRYASADDNLAKKGSHGRHFLRWTRN